MVERFARTAAIAEAAGFDGVQIHAAHGYLISQFLSPLTNRREDEWGGDAERRRRFLIEVVRAVRAAVGSTFAVTVKLNSADFQRGGFTEEESMDVVSALDTEDIDVLEISGGTYEAAVMFSEKNQKLDSTRRREAFFLEYAEKVRARTRLPLMVTGGFRTGEAMRAALSSGAVDLIGMARPFVVESDIPKKLFADPDAQAVAVRLATGIKNLDSLIQGAWYQNQIERMAVGKPPKPSLSRWWAIFKYVSPRRRFARVAPSLPATPRALPSAA